MTTMSQSATIGAEAQVAPKSKARNLSLDRARTFLTLVVLLHHAVIPTRISVTPIRPPGPAST